MTQSTSSAEPSSLIRGAYTCMAIDSEMMSDSHRLAAILSRYESTCTEYRVHVNHLASNLRGLGQYSYEVDDWVQWVGVQFELADIGRMTHTGVLIVVGIARQLTARYGTQIVGVMGTLDDIYKLFKVRTSLRIARGYKYIGQIKVSGPESAKAIMGWSRKLTHLKGDVAGTTKLVSKTSKVFGRLVWPLLGLWLIADVYENWETYKNDGIMKVLIGVVVDGVLLAAETVLLRYFAAVVGSALVAVGVAALPAALIVAGVIVLGGILILALEWMFDAEIKKAKDNVVGTIDSKLQSWRKSVSEFVDNIPILSSSGSTSLATAAAAISGQFPRAPMPVPAPIPPAITRVPQPIAEQPGGYYAALAPADPNDYSPVDGCVQYAKARRVDLRNIGGAGAADFISHFETHGSTLRITESTATDLTQLLHTGDAVVWPRNYDGFQTTAGWDNGHIAIIEEVYVDHVVVSQAGWDTRPSMELTIDQLRSLTIIPIYQRTSPRTKSL